MLRAGSGSQGDISRCLDNIEWKAEATGSESSAARLQQRPPRGDFCEGVLKEECADDLWIGHFPLIRAAFDDLHDALAPLVAAGSSFLGELRAAIDCTRQQRSSSVPCKHIQQRKKKHIPIARLR